MLINLINRVIFIREKWKKMDIKILDKINLGIYRGGEGKKRKGDRMIFFIICIKEN